jgi:hypothetical protein
MAEGWLMRMGIRKAAAPVIVLALAAVGAVGCGSDPETPTTPEPPPVSAATANHLADLSEKIATDLDAGETCDAAYDADQLKSAVESADLSTGLRPGVEQVASDLVNEVNCPPPPAPEPKEKAKKPKEHDEQHGADEGSGPHGHSGGVPPGHAKLKGEVG